MAGVSISLAELIACRRLAQMMKLRQRRKVYRMQNGLYASAFRGRGMDFAETRVYQPGDDIRAMDWKVTARTHVPHTKLYTEEKERSVLLCLDLAPSLYFGTKVMFKSVLAVKIASVLAWAAVQNHDRVGAIIRYGSQTSEFRPQLHASHLLPLLKEIAQLTEHKPQDADEGAWVQALIKLRRVAKPGSLVFIVSDFQSLTLPVQSHLSALARHCECECLFVADPLEQQPPPPGQYWISDGTKRCKMDTRDAQFCADYVQSFQQRLTQVTEFCHQKRIRLRLIATNSDLERVL